MSTQARAFMRGKVKLNEMKNKRNYVGFLYYMKYSISMEIWLSANLLFLKSCGEFKFFPIWLSLDTDVRHQETELNMMKKARSSTKDLGFKVKEKAKVLNMIIKVKNLAYSTTKAIGKMVSKMVWVDMSLEVRPITMKAIT